VTSSQIHNRLSSVYLDRLGLVYISADLIMSDQQESIVSQLVELLQSTRGVKLYIDSE